MMMPDDELDDFETKRSKYKSLGRIIEQRGYQKAGEKSTRLIPQEWIYSSDISFVFPYFSLMKLS